MANEEKIVLRTINRPSRPDIDELADWFCKVFDLSGKDDRLEPAMLKEIVSHNTDGRGTTSKMLNRKLGVPRTTVIYHLNRFIGSGLVIRRGTKYYLRSEDMESTLEELQADMEREFIRMMEFAKKMDEMFESDVYGRKRSKE
jgi:predicted transcriptional regulator